MNNESQQRNDREVQDAAKNLFLGVAPERETELAELWQRFNPRFNILPDDGPEGQFVMDAGAFRDVRFNHRALRAFWVAAFAAWDCFCAWAEGGSDLTRSSQVVECVQRILSAEDPEAVPLPLGIPQPGKLVDPSVNVQLRAASELAIFAAGWALLHEIRHIQHQQDGTSASVGSPQRDKHDEELSCDAFATSFLIENVHIYAAKNGVDAYAVARKRQTGIYFAFFAMSVIAKDKWGASESHPSMQTRIDSTIEMLRESREQWQPEAILVANAAFQALGRLWPGAPVLIRTEGA